MSRKQQRKHFRKHFRDHESKPDRSCTIVVPSHAQRVTSLTPQTLPERVTLADFFPQETK